MFAFANQRTRLDFAEVVRELCDEIYPAAEKIGLVMDQLNTHNIASLSQGFKPSEAKRLAEKLAIHHRRSPHQAKKTLPNNLAGTED